MGVLMATVGFPVGKTGMAHIAWCNLAAVLLLSGHRTSSNPCCGFLGHEFSGPDADTTFLGAYLFAVSHVHGYQNVVGLVFFGGFFVFVCCCFFNNLPLSLSECFYQQTFLFILSSDQS